MIENEKFPTQILINRDQRFAMFLVAVLSHEQWTTSGDFHLRFVRRVPVLDKPCAAPMGGPSTGSASLLSFPGSSSTEGPESSGAESARDEREEQTTSTSTNSDNHADLTDEEPKQNGATHTTGTSSDSDNHAPRQNGANHTTGTSSDSDNHAPRQNGVNHTSGTSTSSDVDEDLTEEEDYRSIGAAALRGVGGGLFPPGMFPPT